MSYTQNLSIPHEAISAFCQRHNIRKLALFGSALHSDFRSDSDIDVLVEFESGKSPDLFRFAEMQDELSEVFGRRVDLNTLGFLSRHFQRKVLKTAEVVYERA